MLHVVTQFLPRQRTTRAPRGRGDPPRHEEGGVAEPARPAQGDDGPPGQEPGSNRLGGLMIMIIVIIMMIIMMIIMIIVLIMILMK